VRSKELTLLQLQALEQLALRPSRRLSFGSARLQLRLSRLSYSSARAPSACTMSSHIALETFQASDFNVAALVEGLMEEDVKKAKAEGGGMYHLTIKLFRCSVARLGRSGA
jgi:hypothetical protein